MHSNCQFNDVIWVTEQSLTLKVSCIYKTCICRTEKRGNKDKKNHLLQKREEKRKNNSLSDQLMLFRVDNCLVTVRVANSKRSNQHIQLYSGASSKQFRQNPIETKFTNREKCQQGKKGWMFILKHPMYCLPPTHYPPSTWMLMRVC